MKPAAILALTAAFSLVAAASVARTVTMSTRNADEQSVNAVAGPPPAKKIATADDKSSAHASKKTLRKTKVTPPPAMHDPN